MNDLQQITDSKGAKKSHEIPSKTNWTASSESGTYRLCEQRRFRRACASAQSRQNLCCSLIQAVSQEGPSDRKPDPWPLWMAGHAQLKFVMKECPKTQIRLTGLKCFKQNLSRSRTKPTIWPVRPAKTQVSLGISPVWSVFAVRSMGSSEPNISSCGQRILWSDWVDAKADLSLRWAHRSFCWFCRAAAHFRNKDI